MPHKMLLAAALAVAFFTAVALHSSGAPASAAAPLDSEEIAFVNLLNNYRAQNGLGPVTPIDTLNAGADWMSYDMGFNNYFDHYDGCVGDCVNGHQRDPNVSRSPWTRMCTHGYCFSTSKGENIAAGFTTAQSVFDAWRNSPGHNANMLGASFRVIGIARVYVAGAPFGYYWTNDFAGFVPAGTSSTPTPAPTASPTSSPTPATSAATASPTRTPSPTPTVAAATPSPTRTLSPTAVPTPTKTPVPPTTPKPSPTPRIIHSVGISYFSVGDGARAGSPVPIVFRVHNWGTQSENVNYGIVSTCMDGNNSKTLECGTLQYSPACFGTVNVPAGKYVQVQCTVTYSSSTGHDRWRHTVTATNSTDSRPSDNTRILERHVY